MFSEKVIKTYYSKALSKFWNHGTTKKIISI